MFYRRAPLVVAHRISVLRCLHTANKNEAWFQDRSLAQQYREKYIKGKIRGKEIGKEKDFTHLVGYYTKHGDLLNSVLLI